MKVYVVTQPASIRGIYDTWADCKAAVARVPGARYQGVTTRQKAEAMLEGGVLMPPGMYAFTDGNGLGGVGIVRVEMGPAGARSLDETSTNVEEIFSGSGVSGLDSAPAVADALQQKRNELAELAGLYHVLSHAEPGSAFTLVYDYEGVAAYIEGRWRKMSPVVAAVIDACRRLIEEHRLHVTFQYQPGHQSTWAGRDDFAHWNAKADALASAGTRPPQP